MTLAKEKREIERKEQEETRVAKRLHITMSCKFSKSKRSLEITKDRLSISSHRSEGRQWHLGVIWCHNELDP